MMFAFRGYWSTAFYKFKLDYPEGTLARETETVNEWREIATKSITF
ncbi:MAG: hypothetical protein QW154_02160 [Sulfolobales archaeon]